LLGEKGFSEVLTCVITHCHWEPKAAIIPVPPASWLYSPRLESRRKDHETCCLSELHPQDHRARLGDSFRDEKSFLEGTKPHQGSVKTDN